MVVNQFLNPEQFFYVVIATTHAQQLLSIIKSSNPTFLSLAENQKSVIKQMSSCPNLQNKLSDYFEIKSDGFNLQKISNIPQISRLPYSFIKFATMRNKIKIRHGQIEDLTKIVDIYNQAIRTKTATGDLEEFKVEDRIAWFYKFDANRYPIYVAELEKKVIGYVTLSPYREGRKAMKKIAEISFYIDYMYQGTGIGSAIVSHAIEDCSRIGKETLLAILLDINTTSIGLLEKFHFQKWGHFPNVVDLGQARCGQFIYGLNLIEKK